MFIHRFRRLRKSIRKPRALLSRKRNSCFPDSRSFPDSLGRLAQSSERERRRLDGQAGGRASGRERVKRPYNAFVSIRVHSWLNPDQADFAIFSSVPSVVAYSLSILVFIRVHSCAFVVKTERGMFGRYFKNKFMLSRSIMACQM